MFRDAMAKISQYLDLFHHCTVTEIFNWVKASIGTENIQNKYYEANAYIDVLNMCKALFH